MPMTLDGTAGMTAPQGAVYNGLQMATAQASTSGTFIDFTGIPIWAKRVTVLFNGVSTNGTSLVLVQIGSGSVTTSGYVSASSNVYGTNTSQSNTSTAGFLINGAGANVNRYGNMVLQNISGNSWVSNHSTVEVVTPAVQTGSGSITLSGVLDRVRITTVGGTDTFDAGSINIMYE